MAVKLRLSRIGKKNSPIWRIVAIDARKKRDGEFLENLGTYNPITQTLVQFHAERVTDWISKGAVCSETVNKLIKLHKKASA